MRTSIWVIDHRDHDPQPIGRIIQVWDIDETAKPGPEYTDFCALHETWTSHNDIGLEPDIIGFFGYRKYFWHPRWYTFLPTEIAPAHAPHWFKSQRAPFDAYRDWWATFDGQPIQELLAQYDILQAAPFPLPGITMWGDFEQSRSQHDATVCEEVLYRHFQRVATFQIYPYLFITRWSVFDRMMREMEPIRLELHGKCRGEDSTNEEYKKRPMAYVMERVYSLWLENSGLSIKEMPLLHCWEKH